jgi:hypothetical protein
LQTFTGHENTLTDDKAAASTDGICVYHRILTEVSDDINFAGKVCVMAGVIELDGKPYDMVLDQSGSGRSADELMLRCLHLYSQVTINVRQTAMGLAVWFEISAKEGVEGQPRKVVTAPLELASQLIKTRGQVHCKNSGCLKVAVVPDGENMSMDVLGTEVRVIRGNRLAKCAAVAVAADSHCRCILKVNECIQCCIRAGLEKSDYWDREDLDLENGLIIVSH